MHRVLDRSHQGWTGAVMPRPENPAEERILFNEDRQYDGPDLPYLGSGGGVAPDARWHGPVPRRPAAGPRDTSMRGMAEGEGGGDRIHRREEGECPYRAALDRSMLEYAERCARLAGSEKPLISSSSSTGLWETVSAAWRAMAEVLGEGPAPEIFQRNGVPVYLRQGAGVGGTRAVIHRHTIDSLRLDVARAAFWYGKIVSEAIATGGTEPLCGEELAPVIEAVQQVRERPHGYIRYTPPVEGQDGVRGWERWDAVYPAAHHPNLTVARSMAASLPRDLDIPLLEAVVKIPVLSRDGRRLLTRRGYHRGESVYVDFDGIDPAEIPPVDECVRRIDDLFGTYAEDPLEREGFPFDSPASRAHLYACLVAGVIGPAVSKKPVFLVDKASPRTGATLLAETISIILTGDLPSYARAGTRGGHSVDEMAKGLSAAVSTSTGVVLIDNATGTLDDPEWNRYATAEVWEARRLGRNDVTVRASRRYLVDILTANNLLLTTESAGRVCISRLDAGMEHPEDRSFQWVPTERAKMNRRHFVEAVVGLVHHWLENGGEPESGLDGWGGFEEWRDMTAAILRAAGVEGFGQAVGLEMRDRLDDGGEHHFVQWWWDVHAGRPVGVRELLTAASVGDDTTGDIGILTAVKGATMRARATSLGSLVRSWQGRVYGLDDGVSVAVAAAGTSNNRALYRLARR